MLRSRALDKPTFRRVVGRIAPALGLALALVTGPVAVADSPGRNGAITFMRQDDAGFWQTWVADADLGHQRQLTDEAANSGWPVWAPTGNRLAIDSDRADPDPGDDTGVNDVFVMNADGSGVRKVTDSVGVSGDPGWSPDGSLLAYEADRGDYPAKQGIYVSRPDGTHLRRVSVLPADAGFDAAARFSPDGRTLVFTRYRDDGQGGEESALFTIRLDGSRERQVTSFALHAGDATWSPDGRTLALEASPTPTSRGDVYTVRPDGSHLRNLTRNDPQVAGSADPVWSPDGKFLLFLSETRTTDGDVTGGLTVMRANGTARRFVPATPMFEHQPDWQAIRR
jgi:TolB protein